jgi:catechol 2,3-dioxygenase-like lactoylglutathione lyase family enzyme
MTRTATATRNILAKFVNKTAHQKVNKTAHRTNVTSPVPTAQPFVPQTISHAAPQAMKVSGLNHFNITASPALIEQLKHFYVEVVGLTVGPRAALDHDGFWLYAGDLSILHLSARQPHFNKTTDKTTDKTTEKEESPLAVPLAACCFDHISLSCEGLVATLRKLSEMRIPYKMIEIKEFGQTQLFIKDPAGIGVELTFSNETF